MAGLRHRLLQHAVLRELWIGIAADLAYHAAWMTGRRLARTLQVDTHLPNCTLVTSALVYVVARAYVDEDLALSLGLASVPRCVVRWFGRGRTSVAKRPASNVGQRVLPNVTVPTQGTSHTARNRYTQEVWGKIFHAGERAGKSTPCADGGEAVQWDLDACRRLLLTIANEDLKERLENCEIALGCFTVARHLRTLTG